MRETFIMTQHAFSPRMLWLSRGDERGHGHSTLELGDITPLDLVAMGRASMLMHSVVEVEILGCGA